MSEALLKDRNKLIIEGIELLKAYERADSFGMINYRVTSSGLFEKIVQPWIDLKNSCVLWSFEIEKFLNLYKIDLAIACEIVTPPTFTELYGGIGPGGEYTTYVLERISFHVEKGLSILKKVSEGSVSDRFTVKLSVDFQSIFFKDDVGSGKLTYVLNADFKHPKTADRGGHWMRLYEVAKNGKVEFEKPALAKAFKDYFNSDKRNRLWSKEAFNRRAILEIENKTGVKPAAGIYMSVLSQKAWAIRKNREAE